MSLSSIYQAFDDAIYQRQTKSLSELVKETSDFTTDERIQVYQNTTWGALIETLEKIFVTCRLLVGDEYFSHLAKLYVKQHESVSVNLDDYGKQFPIWLLEIIKIRPELSNLPYLASVAHCEWALNQSYHAFKRPTFPFEAFSSQQIDVQLDCSLLIAEDLYWLESHYPIDQIIDAHQNHEDDQADVFAQIALDESPRYFIVERKQFKPELSSVKREEYEVLEAVQKGFTLAEISEINDDAASFIPQWIGSGWIVNFLQPKIDKGHDARR